GPEVESWFGVEDGSDPAIENEWPLLPFMALSDGAHTATEDFSYFTLRHEAVGEQPASSLFGISCTRQMDANELISRPKDVTRSTVQKAVVVIADSPQFFGYLRERLSMVTNAWFAQRDFTKMDIIKVSDREKPWDEEQLNVAQKFQESLSQTLRDYGEDKDQYLDSQSTGLPLRELIHEFKHQTLVLFKCCLLQPKGQMLFFGSRCERLCMIQFALISLIPGLIRNLQDCADPELNNYERNLVKPTTLKTSERTSLLSFMGLPLQIFGKGSLFGPYTPLQQLDLLADRGTRSYLVGSTNSLLLQQKDRYCDMLINLDESTINISSTSLRAALALSVADRRWIDFLTQTVNDTWNEANPSQPKTMGYVGSEEFIRLQFEEYMLSMISSVKYHIYSEAHPDEPRSLLPNIDGDPSNDFGADWVDAWMRTDNFKIFHNYTDSHLFDIVEPRHPCAGGLTIEDVQRRLAQQVSELHLDERFNTGKEVLGKHLATGQKKVSSAFNSLWADIEAMREAQRQRQGVQKTATASATLSGTTGNPRSEKARSHRGPNLAEAQAQVAAASSRAGAYFSSWAVWAGEKRKTGWGRSSSDIPLHSQHMSEVNQRSSTDENSEVSHRKPSKDSTSDPSREVGSILKENVNVEDGKREQTSLDRIETSPGSLPRASITTETPTEATPNAKELTSKSDVQENTPQKPHKASV
ncbi:hypothetical protein GP486_007452, partial [Trichoglossum hirsutum]